MLALPFCCMGCGERSRGEVRGDSSMVDSVAVQQEETVAAFYDNEARDVEKVRAVLGKIKDTDNVNERVVTAAREFLGTPYVGGTLNVPTEETLYVNTSGVDCTTFVETVMALAMASGGSEPKVADFLKALRSIRYRDGRIDGYPSRLHYISEWGIDNARRGNFREITPDYAKAERRVKTIDFMSRNRNLYPALADEAVFEAVKEHEQALANLEFAFIPTARVEEAAGFLKSGDIVAIVTEKPGLDVSHVGILDLSSGVPHMIHASSKYKEVIADTTPLKDYLQKQKSPGIRVFRISD